MGFINSFGGAVNINNPIYLRFRFYYHYRYYNHYVITIIITNSSIINIFINTLCFTDIIIIGVIIYIISTMIIIISITMNIYIIYIYIYIYISYRRIDQLWVPYRHKQVIFRWVARCLETVIGNSLERLHIPYNTIWGMITAYGQQGEGNQLHTGQV